MRIAERIADYSAPVRSTIEMRIIMMAGGTEQPRQLFADRRCDHLPVFRRRVFTNKEMGMDDEDREASLRFIL